MTKALTEGSLWNSPLEAFLAQTASADPTPGGGSVSAVCGALGFGLVIMALEVTRRKSEGAMEHAVGEQLQRARVLLARLVAHADGDVEVFESYMRALRMPKQTDEDKVARTLALQRAVLSATEAPLASASDLLKALNQAIKAADLCDLGIVSDVLAGTDLLLGSITAVLRNVDINVKHVKDSEVARRYESEARQLAQQAADASRNVQETATARRMA